VGRDALRRPRESGKRTDRPADTVSGGSTELQNLASEHGVTERALERAAEYAAAVDALEDLAPGFRAQEIAPKGAPR
jgi:hypothetical protein